MATREQALKRMIDGLNQPLARETTKQTQAIITETLNKIWTRTPQLITAGNTDIRLGHQHPIARITLENHETNETQNTGIDMTLPTELVNGLITGWLITILEK